MLPLPSSASASASAPAMPPGCAPFANLPVRVISMTDEEFAGVRDSLKDAGLANPISRFNAIRGLDMRDKISTDPVAISPRALYEIEHAKSREAHSSMPSWGGVGCYLSHEALWREAAASREGLIVAEADCRPTLDAVAESARVFSNVCAFLGRPPDLLWFGWLVLANQIVEEGLKGAVRVPERALGAHFYYVSPSGAQTLLSRSRPIEVQVDSYMGYMTEIAKMGAFASSRTLYVQKNEKGTKIQLKRVEDIMATSPQENDTATVKMLLFACVVISIALAAAALVMRARDLRSTRYFSM